MWADPKTGVRHTIWGFVMVLACSRLMFLRPVIRLDQTSWCEGHVEAFAFFGGVPARLVPDNLKTGVDRPDLYDPKINRTYAELATHYGFTRMPFGRDLAHRCCTATPGTAKPSPGLPGAWNSTHWGVITGEVGAGQDRRHPRGHRRPGHLPTCRHLLAEPLRRSARHVAPHRLRPQTRPVLLHRNPGPTSCPGVGS